MNPNARGNIGCDVLGVGVRYVIVQRRLTFLRLSPTPLLLHRTRRVTITILHYYYDPSDTLLYTYRAVKRHRIYYIHVFTTIYRRGHRRWSRRMEY